MAHTASLETPDLAGIVRFYETLTLESVAGLVQWYAADAAFKDPFNDVRGVDAIARIFRHMFTQVDHPRFVVHDALAGDGSAVLLWDFLFETRRGGDIIRGATHLRFNAQGLICLHRDYWDSAEELYMKIPLLGWPLRALRRRLQA